jgi:hypothetical protein
MDAAPPIDRELTKVFQSKPWRRVFRAQLAASIVGTMQPPIGMYRPDYIARETLKVVDAILKEVGLNEPV